MNPNTVKIVRPWPAEQPRPPAVRLVATPRTGTATRPDKKRRP